MSQLTLLLKQKLSNVTNILTKKKVLSNRERKRYIKHTKTRDDSRPYLCGNANEDGKACLTPCVYNKKDLIIQKPGIGVGNNQQHYVEQVMCPICDGRYIVEQGLLEQP